MWQVALGLVVLLAAPTYAGYDMRRVQGTTAECAPSFFAMDPDAGFLYVFSVVVPNPDGHPWAREFRFPIGARCAETRAALLDVLSQLPGVAVMVTTCH